VRRNVSISTLHSWFQRSRILNSLVTIQQVPEIRALTFLLPFPLHLGCDCLPYLNASRTYREVNVRRGNCQAHSFYDLCKILPNIKLIRGQNYADDDVTFYPNYCVGISSWFSTHSASWPTESNTDITPSNEYFLDRLIEASEMILHEDYYESCMDMETAQLRITEVLPTWQNVSTTGLPIGRNEACFVMAGGKGYLIGGRGFSPGGCPVDEYDPRTRKWTAKTAKPGTSYINHMQCVEYSSKIWIVTSWTGFYPNEQDSSVIHIYDPATDTWDSSRAGLPAQRLRGSTTTVVYKDRFYISHGNTGTSLCQKTK
jgi:hypothetical protein